MASVGIIGLWRAACRPLRRNHVVLHGETELVPMAHFYTYVSGVITWYRGVSFRLREVRRALVR